MSRRKGHRRPTRYEDLTPEEIETAREAIHRGERSRGQSYASEEPRSWIGKKARALKERFKGKEATKEKGKVREFYDREIKGGLTEAREELGLEEAMAARGAGVRGKVKRAKGLAPKLKKGGWGPSPSGGGRGPQGPHFMQSVTQGSVRGPAMNPAAMMGWGAPAVSRQAPRRRAHNGRGRGAAPGTIIIYAGGAGPQAPRKAARKAPRKRGPKRAPAGGGFMPGVKW